MTGAHRMETDGALKLEPKEDWRPNDGCMRVTSMNKLERLRHRLFPMQPRPLISNEKRTYLTTEIYTKLDWKDRLRALFSKQMRVTVITYTDIEVKHADSTSVCWFE